ncbi:hypothetical protein SUGI_0218920 [Cryptomeria japonica]|nr:hypothetical protein SUGI_0218920 [Cryptomeria japonica]
MRNVSQAFVNDTRAFSAQRRAYDRDPIAARNRRTGQKDKSRLLLADLGQASALLLLPALPFSTVGG